MKDAQPGGHFERGTLTSASPILPRRCVMSCARPLVLVSAVGLATGVPAWGQGYEPEHLQDPPAAVLPTATSIPNIGMVDGPGFFLSQVNVNAARRHVLDAAVRQQGRAPQRT